MFPCNCNCVILPLLPSSFLGVLIISIILVVLGREAVLGVATDGYSIPHLWGYIARIYNTEIRQNDQV